MARTRIKRVTVKRKRKKQPGCLSYILVSLISAYLAVILAFNLYLASLQPISNFKDIKPNPVTAIYSSDGENIKTFTAYKFEKVSIDDIPDNLKNAVIATEDKNFYRHRGFDTMGLIRSAITNIRAGSLKQGASTITQQLARILFLSNERTFDRKIKELIIAHRIEKTISKDEILEMYMNSVYLGAGTYGVLSASKTYFDKELDELTLAEAALIAGLPQAPSVYSPFTNPDAAINRRNQVLKRMLKTGYIDKKQYKQALDEPLKLNDKPRIYSFNKAPYFIDYVLRELNDIGFDETEISQGGLKIYTTLNYKDQLAADEAITNGLKNAGLRADKTQMALFAFSPTTGKIIAYVGGKNYEKSQYDRIVNAIRPKVKYYAIVGSYGWGGDLAGKLTNIMSSFFGKVFTSFSTLRLASRSFCNLSSFSGGLGCSCLCLMLSVKPVPPDRGPTGLPQAVHFMLFLSISFPQNLQYILPSPLIYISYPVISASCSPAVFTLRSVPTPPEYPLSLRLYFFLLAGHPQTAQQGFELGFKVSHLGHIQL